MHAGGRQPIAIGHLNAREFAKAYAFSIQEEEMQEYWKGQNKWEVLVFNGNAKTTEQAIEKKRDMHV